jgi:hypothetical protein
MNLDEFEYISIRRAISILSNHPLILVCSNSLNIEKYMSEYDQFLVERFHDSFFESIDGYNRLMMSRGFYKRFLNYKYILIYQLDAYVFRDELNYWCSLNLDYIGAPIVTSSEFEGTASIKYLKGRNGGLSLRKTRSHYNSFNYYLILKIVKWMFETWEQSKHIKSHTTIKPINFLVTCLLKALKQSSNIEKIQMNEDGYWSIVVPCVNWKFRVADVDQAMRFAFEKNPDVLFKMTNFQLPFGCHAWQKYNSSFWKRYIK